MQSFPTLFEIEDKPVEADEFKTFWLAYPRKVARGHAERMFRRARKIASYQEIMDGLSRYVAQIRKKRTEPDYIAHAGTWLNAQRWLDEIETKPQAKQEDRDAEYARQWLRQNGFPEEPPV